MQPQIAVAYANIALIKYWGKAAPKPSSRGVVETNLPAVPSLSLTLDGLKTITEVSLIHEDSDRVLLDGQLVTGKPRERVIAVLDRMRKLAGSTATLQIQSKNEFPTAAGLASSASGFAALAVAASAFFRLDLSSEQLSYFARAASASAGRSIFGGWAELLAEGESASPIAEPGWLDVEMVIAITKQGPKAIGSTEGMLHTKRTSPYYEAWEASAPSIFSKGKSALLARDFSALGEAMEQSTLLMHSSMFGADPAIIYWEPSSLGIIKWVREARTKGIESYFTLDAGPHVKVLVRKPDAARLAAELAKLPGVLQVIRCGPGPAAQAL